MLFRPKDHQSVAKTGSFVMIIEDQPSHLRTQCSGAMILIEIRIGPSTPSTPSRLCWHSLIPCSGVMINTEIGRRHIRMMIIGIRNSLHHHLDFPRASMGVREGQRGGYNHQSTEHCTLYYTAHWWEIYVTTRIIDWITLSLYRSALSIVWIRRE